VGRNAIRSDEQGLKKETGISRAYNEECLQIVTFKVHPLGKGA
jgi:hypothetical protein